MDSKSKFGMRLFELLPSIYRERDNSDRNLKKGELDPHNGDLGRYLDASGHLLDLVYQTLLQRLADSFPDSSENGLECQEWLLPYFAQLLDVKLLSPTREGKQGEIGKAVRLRQGKGTLSCAEEVAETVGSLEIEVQEGWQRTAVTPRVGQPLLPARYFGCASEPVSGSPSHAARHPALPAASVDFRCASAALSSPQARSFARETSFDGKLTSWRQAARHGNPCYPGSFEDVSSRTVDFRSPSWDCGQMHPRRLLCYFPPHPGFFPDKTAETELRPDNRDETGAVFSYQPAGRDGRVYRGYFPFSGETWKPGKGSCGILILQSEGDDPFHMPVCVTEVDDNGLVLNGPPPPAGSPGEFSSSLVRLQPARVLAMPWDQRGNERYRAFFEDADEKSAEPGGPVESHLFRNKTLGKRWFMPIRVRGVIELNEALTYRFEGLHLENTLRITQGRVSAFECALRMVEILTIDYKAPVLAARNTLFRRIQAARGVTRLEYCTVLDQTLSEELQSSDCIFLGILRCHHHPLLPPSEGCLRYCRLMPGQNTTGLPTFRCNSAPVSMYASDFGERGCGVLHPATSISVRFGAEDGGELGAYHGRRYTLREKAVEEKLKDFLPIGLEAVLIPDERLLSQPPEDSSIQEG